MKFCYCTLPFCVAAIQYVTYSCDTPNATDGTSFFDAVPLAITNGKQCPFASPSADPLGPCFVSPASVKAKLDVVPPGRRAISLEGSSMYYLQDSSRAWYFQDRIESDGCEIQSPWASVWSESISHRFDAWFANFSALGGEVDIILSDFEMGADANWNHFAGQKISACNSSSVLPQDVLVKDPRWPNLLQLLSKEGQKHNTSFTSSSLADMQHWQPFHWQGQGQAQGQAALRDVDLRPWIWNTVVVDQLLSKALNSSVYEPIKAFFPQVAFSNFGFHYYEEAYRSSTRDSGADSGAVSGTGSGAGIRTTYNGRTGSDCADAGMHGSADGGDGWWPFEASTARAPIGSGKHIGTHQSLSFYGGNPFKNTSGIMFTQTATSVVQVASSAFAAVVLGGKIARSVYQGGNRVSVSIPSIPSISSAPSAPSASSHQVPTHPWFAPRELAFMEHGAREGSWLQGSDMWQENVFHVALASGATTFLWWKPGSTKNISSPVLLGVPLMIATMRELTEVTTVPPPPAPATPANSRLPSEITNCSAPVPIVGEETSIASWSVPYVLSGARVTCTSTAPSSASSSNSTGSTSVTITRDIYRFTPSCLINRTSAASVAATAVCAYPGAGTATPGTPSPTFTIAGGFKITPVEHGKIFIPAHPHVPVSAAGFWIVREAVATGR
jgi:hypothetical protein